MKCPECKEHELSERGIKTNDHRYYCPACRSRFGVRVIAEITRLRSIVEPLEALLGNGDADKMAKVVSMYRSEEADGGGFIVQTLDDYSHDVHDTLPDALAATQAAAESQSNGL